MYYFVSLPPYCFLVFYNRRGQGSLTHLISVQKLPFPSCGQALSDSRVALSCQRRKLADGGVLLESRVIQGIFLALMGRACLLYNRSQPAYNNTIPRPTKNPKYKSLTGESQR